MNKIAMLLLLVFAPVVVAADEAPPVVIVPPAAPEKWIELLAPAGKAVQLTVPGDDVKEATWILVDNEVADIFTCDKGKNCRFTAPFEGRYKLIVIAGPNVYRIALTLGKAPKPPAPPAPVDDVLVKALQAAFDADALQLDVKRGQLVLIQELYDQAVEMADDKTVLTVEMASTRLKEASKALKITALTDMRKVIAGQLAVAFPNGGAVDDVGREKLKATYVKLRDALKAVKQ